MRLRTRLARSTVVLALSVAPLACGRSTSPPPAASPAPRAALSPGAGRWQAAGPLHEARGGLSVATMRDGRVIAIGGSGNGLRGSLASTEIFDPTTNVWTRGPALVTPRSGHASVALPDGRIVVFGGRRIGGVGAFGNEALASAELYEPATGRFRATRPLHVEMPDVQAAGLLSDGSVVAVGGAHLGDPHVELFDPVAERWTAAPRPRRFGTTFQAATVPHRGVVLFGGVEYRTSLWRGFWRMGGGGSSARAVHVDRAGLLASGAGPWRYGRDPVGAKAWALAGALGRDLMIVEAQRAVLFDTAQRKTESHAPPSLPRSVTSTLTALDEDRMLALGGEGPSAGSAELFQRTTRTWTRVAPPPWPLSGHVATRLDDGRVLVIDGRDPAAPDPYLSHRVETALFAL